MTTLLWLIHLIRRILVDHVPSLRMLTARTGQDVAAPTAIAAQR